MLTATLFHPAPDPLLRLSYEGDIDVEALRHLDRRNAHRGFSRSDLDKAFIEFDIAAVKTT